MIKEEKYRKENIKKELTSQKYWEKLTQKRLKKTNKDVMKHTERDLKRNKLSLEDNLKNGVKLLEESFRTTNSEYWHNIKNKDNEALETEEGDVIYKVYEDHQNNNKENDPHFIPWIINGPSFHYLITLDTVKQKIKENLGLPKNSSIRYDKVKCSKNCNHNDHYYFYAYWWDPIIKKMRKKYIGKNLPIPVEIIS